MKGGKVEKVYQLDKDNIIFRIYNDGSKFNLRICVPSLICLTNQDFDAPVSPPGFCMFLRKYLSNARIESVEQRDFERILVFKFSKKDGFYFLIVELFKPGNVILCREDEDGSLLVINSKDRQRFKDRLVQARKPYVFPPALLNPLSVGVDDIVSLVNSSDRNLVKSMASGFGFGGVFSEEILVRAGIDKDKTVINLVDAGKIKGAIVDFFSEDLKPFVFGDVVFPVVMKTKKGVFFNSISEAVDSFNLLKKDIENKSVVSLKKKEKTDSLVDIQERMIKNLEQSISENKEKGEFIYSNYQDFDKLLNFANSVRSKDGLDVLEREMRKNKRFVSLNKKTKEISFKF